MKIFSVADLGKEKKTDWRCEESNPEPMIMHLNIALRIELHPQIIFDDLIFLNIQWWGANLYDVKIDYFFIFAKEKMTSTII